MNLNMNPTVKELRQLIEACDDRAGNHVLWVAKDGEVHVSRVSQDVTLEDFEKAHSDMRLRYETFQAGNEYVGPEAAEDGEWINYLFDALRNEWPKAKSKREVEYIGQI